MPKTRHEKFYQSFTNYMSNLKINDLDYELNYILTNTTNNQTKSIHSYTLGILGSREGVANTGENIVEMLPTTKDFIDNMVNYFEPFAHYNHRLHNREKVSYIDILTEKTNDCISTIVFQIIYFGKHLPFPLSLTVHEQLIQDIEILSSELHEQGKQLNRMRRKYNTEKERLRKVQKKVQSKMERIYSEQDTLEDCPVCLDAIQKNNLYIPLCFHYICYDCSKRCDKCPLCREPYVLLVQ